MTIPHQQKLSLVRADMQALELDAYFVPRADEYLGEYVPVQNERLQWISGFTGSAGAAVILQTSAAIFVDGRYTIQVRQQVPDNCFNVHHLIEEPPITWLANNVKAGQRVGIDTRMIPMSQYENWEKVLNDNSIELVEIEDNLIDKNWSDRPEPPFSLA